MVSSDWLTQQQHKFESAANDTSKEYNETERLLGTQLLFAAATIITIFAAIAFSSAETFENLVFTARILIAGGLVLLVSSLAFGIVHYFRCLDFLVRWQKANEDISRQVSNSSISTPKELEVARTNRFNGLKPRSSIGVLIIQTVLLFFGLACLIASVLIIVFR